MRIKVKEWLSFTMDERQVVLEFMKWAQELRRKGVEL